MFHLVLFEPEIPPNTGNIIRLCANTGVHCHLIEPLGFDLSDKQCRRAGLDYHDLAKVSRHASYQNFLDSVQSHRIWFLTTKGSKSYAKIVFKPGDVFVFGPETRGLPAEILKTQSSSQWLYIPQRSGSRSLNLSNAAAVTIYEALRQTDFIFT